MFLSVATPSEVRPSDNKVSGLQYLMIMSGNLIQSESLDTSIDNANICHTAENTANIVPLLLCAFFLLTLILGCLLCVIFNRFFRN